MSFEITSEESLREILGAPIHESVVTKSTSSLTEPLKVFIRMSPFLALGTCNADGNCDLSPRGDPPGFVHIPDDKTLVIPDRPGNKHLDSIINIISQPRMEFMDAPIADDAKNNMY